MFDRNRRFCQGKNRRRLPGREHHTCWPSHRGGRRPTFGPADLARLPGLLCIGSAELVLPCSLPCFALPRPPASLIRESTKGGGTKRRLPYEACWWPRQGKARQTARQDQLSQAKAKQARQPSQIGKGQGSQVPMRSRRSDDEHLKWARPPTK